MSYLATQPDVMAAAAQDLAGIRAALAQATDTAAGQTTGFAAAAADEVSEAAAQLFRTFGLEYQNVVGQAVAFHDEFNRALAAASGAYAEAEVANAAVLSGALASASPIEALFAPVLAPLQPLLAPIQSVLAPLQSLLGGPAATASGGTPVTMPVGTSVPTVYDVALIMSGSGTPIPSLAYMASVRPWIQFHVTNPLSIPLNTPEGLYPLTHIKDLPLNQSVATGVTALHNALFSPTGLITAGQKVSVLGYSQSAVLSSIELRNLIAAGSPHTGDLSFTLLGNPMAPNGGLLSRFPGLSLPALGLDFYGPTPANSGYPVNMFSLQYDGYTDFPRYPINFLADLNAFLGIQSVHGTYPNIINPTTGQLAPGYKMVELPVSPTTAANGLDHYYMITYDHLPLVQPIRAIPVIGNALADLVEPNLTYLVNWGYGDPHYGYSTSYADVWTPFGLIPPIPQNFIGDQVALAGQGWGAFVGDIQAMVPTSLPSLTDLLPAGVGGGAGLPFTLPGATGSPVNSFIDALRSANTNIVNSITKATADGYALLLPTADIANTIATTLPSYDFNLFLDGVQQAVNGDPMGLVNAIGNPIAANVALLTLAGGFQTIVTLDTVESVIGDLTGG
ncbi:PE-PPE domain-containing protein [Mycobacterium vicinigordonae]|uniref:PE-PPE domain-containing protein n=1 Tax=Mycobacterium vicinigordonae TaxID=1719132 RepID=A0A7D6DYX0_9MYCO|nr:PE-PPE domain-containing protein [Mycobacterium vicinigordonae]QLL07788.1 PE-PPE domain-containing protein [Mycobacterium vicinigordonae]